MISETVKSYPAVGPPRYGRCAASNSGRAGARSGVPLSGYGVKIVRDGELPADIDWMFVKGEDGALVLYLTQASAGCARALSEAWAAYRVLEREAAAIPCQEMRVAPLAH